MVVIYDNCNGNCTLNGSAAVLAGHIDVNGTFDRGNGVLKACSSCVKDAWIKCWAAPANAPVPCVCPGIVASEATGTSPALAVTIGVASGVGTILLAVGLRLLFQHLGWKSVGGTSLLGSM